MSTTSSIRGLPSGNRFTLWRRSDKVPVGPFTFEPADPRVDPVDQSTAELLANASFGVGLLIGDGVGFIDLDHCAVNGVWLPGVQAIVDRFPGAYVEVSQSGTGLHIIFMYTGPRPAHGTRATIDGVTVELYTADRYCAITGTRAQGDAAVNHTAALHALIGQHFAATSSAPGSEWTTEPIDGRERVADEEIIAVGMRMHSAAATFGSRASFSDLWGGDTSAFGGDESRADSALAGHLLFLTGGDCARTLELMQHEDCGLRRDKWNRSDYLERTILFALKDRAARGDWCERTMKPNPASEPVSATVVAQDMKYLATAEQLANRYVFIGDRNAYYNKESRAFLTADAVRTFESNAIYGRDPVKELRACGNELFRRVHSIGYHPGAEEIYREVDGTLRLNTWRDPKIVELEPTPAEHLTYTALFDRVLGADTVERRFIKQSLAYLVQNPAGRLPYSIVLAGTQGNGKSTLLEVIPRLLFGSSNVSVPSNREVVSNFSDWLGGARIVSVPELWLGVDPRKAEGAANDLKAAITSSELRIVAKGRAGLSQPNRTTLFATSNHRDALRLQADDRRYFVAWTEAPKFTEAERRRFFDEFLETPRAAGVLLWILRRVDLSGFDVRAEPPSTAAKVAMIHESLPDSVASLREAIDDGAVCFKRGVFTIEEARVAARLSPLASTHAIGRALKHSAIKAHKLGQKRIGGTRPHVWTLDVERWKQVAENEIELAFIQQPTGIVS
jgi:hypothetical protein